MIKIGFGTLTLSGSNTYSGGTIVDTGKLILAGNDALARGSSLTVGTGTLAVAPSAASTTYNLAAAVSTPLLHSGGTTTVTATITNAGSGLADRQLCRHGPQRLRRLALGRVCPRGGPLAQNAADSGSQTYTASVPGAISLTPSVSGATNATIGGAAAAGTVTTATLNVFSGSGT